MQTPPPSRSKFYTIDFQAVKAASARREEWRSPGMRNPLDEFVIERVMVSETPGFGNIRRRRTPRQSAASAAFSVALGRIAADVLAESGR